MLMAVESGGGGATAPSSTSSAVVDTNKITAGGPDYSEEGESSPKMCSLDPAVAAVAAVASVVSVNNNSNCSCPRDQQQQPHQGSTQRQQRHRTTTSRGGDSLEKSGGGGHRPRTMAPGALDGGSGVMGRGPEVPSPFRDLPPSEDLSLTVADAIIGSGSHSRRRTQRPTYTVGFYLSFWALKGLCQDFTWLNLV